VLVTNVLLAGMATHGICEGLIKLCFRDHTIIVSEHILLELREHYIGKFKATDEQAALAVDVFRKQSELVVPAAIPIAILRDADDLPVVGTAVAGSADYLVTGDKQPQELAAYQNVTIVSPRQFYDRLRVTT
jgi:putative PIN family toxin of toxin-antitoxin system